MAVVDLKSLTLTDLEAEPQVVNSVLHNHGRLRVKSDFLTSASGDDDLSLYRFFRVRSSDSIKSLQFRSEAIGSASGWDCGLYTIDGGAEVDLDLYADGFDPSTIVPVVPHIVAEGPYLELRFGDSATSILSDINNAVWQDLGLSTDPFLEYDVVVKAVTAGSGGIISLMMFYTSGD